MRKEQKIRKNKLNSIFDSLNGKKNCCPSSLCNSIEISRLIIVARTKNKKEQTKEKKKKNKRRSKPIARNFDI